ncbi:MAG: FAD-binding oxidoreductase, partial [Verrucomicrobiota bacterium]
MALSESLVAELRQRIAPDALLTSAEDLIPYSFDGTAAMTQMPGAVVFARSAADVVAVLEIAQRTRTAVVTRGSGTGLSGGSLPSADCIVLCTVKMNRIL